MSMPITIITHQFLRTAALAGRVGQYPVMGNAAIFMRGGILFSS